eukprot:jgi/Astpho2/1794/Aster-07554
MPTTPEEEARILQLTQLINARHGAAKPQNTVQAEKSAAKLWRRYCEQEAHLYPDGDLMSQAKILEFSVWLVDVAVQQNGARYSFSSVGDYLCHLKEVCREQYSEGRITSGVPAPLEIQAVRDLLRARGREMQAENLNAQVAAQGNQPMCGETLNVHLRQAFELAGVPCGRLDGYSAKGEVSHKFKKHGVEAAKSVGINKAEIKMTARHVSDTTDLYCIFDPDTAHRLAGRGRDWHEIHRLRLAD